MISLSQVTAIREGRFILSDVNLTLNPGEHVVVRGEAGSGKTTLLEMMSGRLHPVRGQVRYTRDTDAPEGPYMLYLPALALQATCAQPDLFYQQRYYSLGDEEVPTVAEYLGAEVSVASGVAVMESIKPLLPLKITRLSNGQSRKVLLCRHLMQQIPQVLLLDYPLEGLDAASRRDWIQFLEYLAAEHKVQLVITEHGDALPKMIQTVWHVADGTVRVEAMNKQEVSATPVVPAYVPAARVGEPVVEFRGLNLRYGDRDIIRDFHWRVNRGDRWVLCGPNGSGKTTMFSFIFADHPWAYREPVYIFGRRRGTGESIWDIKKRITYLGPEPAAFQHHQALPQSAAAYLRQRYPTSLDMIQSLVQHWQLEKVIHQPIRTLSSGTRQLLWLAEALLADRELLLLDEPFRFLDPLARQRVTHYLQHHLGEDKTLIIITHDEDDLQRWGQQVMRLVPNP